MQVYGRSSENPTVVNIKGSVITFLNPDIHSIVNFEQSKNPNKIVSELETYEGIGVIKGSVLIGDKVEIYIGDKATIARCYPVFVKYKGKPLENIRVEVLKEGKTIGVIQRTDAKGYVELALLFRADSINDKFKIKLEYDGLSYSDDISLKTSTPLIFDEQVLVPEFEQVKDNKILIYGSSVVIVFIIALILLYYLKKKKL